MSLKGTRWPGSTNVVSVATGFVWSIARMGLLGEEGLPWVEHGLLPPVWFQTAVERSMDSEVLAMPWRDIRFNPLMLLLSREARNIPVGGRTVVGLLYLASARFHFFWIKYFLTAQVYGAPC